LISNVLQIALPSPRLESFLARVLASDGDPVVRHEAAFVIGELKASGHVPGNLLLKALCRAALTDNSLIVVHEAAEALGNFDGVDVISTLSKLEQHVHPDVRATAAISLEEISLRNRRTT
jgi:hypothetical protein